MRKILLSMVCLSVLVFALSGVSYGWQGRMGGAGDPYGLLQDESDFLIHPAKIANGEGIKFYGHYGFTYTDVMDWDYDLDALTTAGVLSAYFNFGTSGQEYKHNALLGAATPLGPGRFGIFFTYDGMRGDYDGSEDIRGMSNYAEYDLTKDLDNFAVRLLYGLPVGGIDVGMELGMAYRDEVQKMWWNQTDMFVGTQNYWFVDYLERSLFPYMIPYDSQYWELLWKAGMGKQFDSMEINVSLHGGYIVSSDNNYEYLWQAPVGSNNYNANLDGNVAGWRIGSDVWMRVSAGGGLTLPFLFSIDYAEKKRDGDGVGTGITDAGLLYDYTHKEPSLDLKAGGGIEKKLGNDALIGAGLYYNYLQRKDDFCLTRNTTVADSSDYPSLAEHRVIVRLVGEVELSPAVALRMGLEPFYGWVREDFTYSLGSPAPAFTDDTSLNGSHWGIGGSVGASVQFDGFTMEPFINGGWQQIDLDGNGSEITSTGVIWYLREMSLSRSEWYIGGGCSFLYDLP